MQDRYQPPSTRYKGRPHISLDALTDVCYAAASGYETALRQMLTRALWEYSGKAMPWHEEYVEAVVSDVAAFVAEESQQAPSHLPSELDEP